MFFLCFGRFPFFCRFWRFFFGAFLCVFIIFLGLLFFFQNPSTSPSRHRCCFRTALFPTPFPNRRLSITRFIFRDLGVFPLCHLFFFLPMTFFFCKNYSVRSSRGAFVFGRNTLFFVRADSFCPPILFLSTLSRISLHQTVTPLFSGYLAATSDHCYSADLCFVLLIQLSPFFYGWLERVFMGCFSVFPHFSGGIWSLEW